MIKNYFKIAIRNLIRHKSFSAINIAGLAIGVASCLLLFTVISYELSYDKFQPEYKKIYRIVTQDKYADGVTYNPGVSVAGLYALRTKMPDVLFAAINSNYGDQISVGNTNSSSDKKFIEQSGLFFCEPEFFKVFNYTWLAGNASVLNEPNTIVLTKKIAEKYFGSWQQAINKTVKLDNAIPLKVSGILQDVPFNSDFPLGELISFETLKSNGEQYNYHNDWNTLSSNFQVYALLPQNVFADKINKELVDFSKEHYKERDEYYKRLNILQPLSALHFDSRFETFGNHITSMSVLWTLSLIGIFILIMACINFINLSTAQAVGRSKEIGIRKVLGSNRKQLFVQVMGETALLVCISVVIAVIIAALCLPYLKHFASIEETLSLLNFHTLLFLICIIAIVTFLSGLYPSLTLSGYKPVVALKNKIASANVGGISLRRGLVVAQFGISQILIIGTIVAVSQMNFIHNADLGFNKEAVVILTGNTDSTVIAAMPAFKQKLLQIPGVQSASFSSDAPSSDNTWSTNFAFNHKEDEKFPLTLKFADEDYFKTFGLQFSAGHAFDKSDTTNEVVINETLVKKLGLRNDNEAIGKDLRIGSEPWKRISGVVKDFKTNSLKKDIKPLMIAENKKFYGNTSIKLRSSNIPQTQAAIQSAWNEYFPAYAYSSNFMDENIAKFYEQETHLESLYKIFAGLAIFISCLGLYGLVSFMAVQKTKEIGVRKVLGASVANIIYLFSKEFTILIIVAFAIAAPVAYYMMHSWLGDFVYRIQISAWIFILAILTSIIIAWITVGYKALKAAMVNPVKSLRSE